MPRSTSSAAKVETTARFLRALDGMVEEAYTTDRWDRVARALQAGLADERTRIRSFCVLADVIMKRLFVLREADRDVQTFLVDRLRLDPLKAGPVGLMAIDAAKKAVDVCQAGRSIDDVVGELVRDHKADPALARPLVETGIRFLARESPSRKQALLALLGLASHPLVSVPGSVAAALILALGFGVAWGLAALVAAGLVVLAFVANAAAAACLRRDRKRPLTSRRSPRDRS